MNTEIRYCEVTWGDGDPSVYFAPRCTNPGEYVAVSIADQTSTVFVVCECHKQIAERLPLNWAVARLPAEAAIGTRKEAQR